MARGTRVQPGRNGSRNNLRQGGPQLLVRYFGTQCTPESNVTRERKSGPPQVCDALDGSNKKFLCLVKVLACRAIPKEPALRQAS